MTQPTAPGEKYSRREVFKKTITSTSSLVVAMSFPIACSPRMSLDKSVTNQIKTIYLTVTPENRFLLTFDKTELGQGVITGQATLFGEEADISPDRFTMNPAMAAEEYESMGIIQFTGGSTSTSEKWMPLRKAGASYKQALLTAASRKLKKPISSLTTTDGKVLIKESHTALDYAYFNDAILHADFQENPPLKAKEDFIYIGTFSQSIDAKEKCTGPSTYGIDKEIDGMRIAVVIRPPVHGSRLGSFDKKSIMTLEGVEDCFEVTGGLALISDRFHKLLKVKDQVAEKWVTWNTKDTIKHSSTQLRKDFHHIINEKKQTPSADKNTTVVEATYELPYLAHAPMEPQNCSAFFDGKELTVWAPTQYPSLVRQAGANICEISPNKVKVHVSKFLGGGFGRQTAPSTHDAIEITTKLKKPVKLIWTREDDMTQSALRPMSVNYLSASFTKSSQEILEWNYLTASQSIIQDALVSTLYLAFPNWMQEGAAKTSSKALAGTLDAFSALPMAVDGAKQPYDLPYQIDAQEIELDIPTFFWRSVGNSVNGFVMESFVDEVAESMGTSSLELRLRLLKGNSRAIHVLQKVVENSNYKQRNSTSKEGWGLAYHFSFFTHCAQVAQVTIDDENQIRVKKIWAVVDCGQPINPHLVEAQVRSGIIYGLSAALYGEIEFKEGEIVQKNFDTYRPLTLSQTPEVEVYQVKSDAPPTGIGEPGLPPAAAAVANAVFQASGKRIRSLPLQKNFS